MAKLLSGHCSSESVGLVGRLENKSTDHKEGIAPVPLWVRPEPRRPGWDYRSPIIADNLQVRTPLIIAQAVLRQIKPNGTALTRYWLLLGRNVRKGGDDERENRRWL